MNKLTTIYFDLFGVLLGADKSTIIQYISVKTNNQYEIVDKVFSEQFNKFEKRDINFNQFFQNLQYGLVNGELLPVAEFKSTWMQQELSELPTVNYLLKLKEKYSINLISNISNSYLKLLQKKFDFFKVFEFCITSELANASKPSKDIFHYALKKTGTLASEALFIDDQKQNVNSAESIGMKGHQYISYHQFKKYIETYV